MSRRPPQGREVSFDTWFPPSDSYLIHPPLRRRKGWYLFRRCRVYDVRDFSKARKRTANKGHAYGNPSERRQAFRENVLAKQNIHGDCRGRARTGNRSEYRDIFHREYGPSETGPVSRPGSPCHVHEHDARWTRPRRIARQIRALEISAGSSGQRCVSERRAEPDRRGSAGTIALGAGLRQLLSFVWRADRQGPWL